MKFLTLALSLLLVIPMANAQTFTPKSLGSGINSTYDEVSPVILPDQKTLLFSRRNHPQNGFGEKNSADIWISTLQPSGSWSQAQRSSALNIGQNNYALAITSDGNTLLLHTDEGLSVSTKHDNSWSPPQKLNIASTTDATMSADGKFILYKKKSLLGLKSQLLVIERNENGSWKEPVKIENLDADVNTPFLAIDNQSVYFSQNNKGKGTDVFRVKRLSEDWTVWSKPFALNDTINTTGDESYMRANLNASIGFYSTTTNSVGKGDIYVVKLYEDRPYVLVKGNVINAKSKRVLKNKDIKILVDGKPALNPVVLKDSGTYEIKLPLGKRYTVSAELYQYGAQSYTIDATTDREYREQKLDLEEAPVDFVLLKGKLLIKNTDNIIPPSAKALLMIDGEEVDTAHVDLEKGTYSIQLKLGSLYYVQVSAQHFESLPDILDLKDIDGYEEITFNLHADAEKMAIVNGRILDKKTAQALPVTTPVQVQVEGVSSVAAAIDSTKSEYELRFPLKASYTISAVSEGYYPVYEIIDVVNETNEVNITRDLTIVPVERGQSVRINNVAFEPGKKIALTQASTAELDRLVKYLEANPKVKIEIGAYTDATTKAPTLNQAKAVVAYITGKGIARHRVTARGYGAAKPVGSNKTPEGRAQNRRIEFLFLEK